MKSFYLLQGSTSCQSLLSFFFPSTSFSLPFFSFLFFVPGLLQHHCAFPRFLLLQSSQVASAAAALPRCLTTRRTSPSSSSVRKPLSRCWLRHLSPPAAGMRCRHRAAHVLLDPPGRRSQPQCWLRRPLRHLWRCIAAARRTTLAALFRQEVAAAMLATSPSSTSCGNAAVDEAVVKVLASTCLSPAVAFPAVFLNHVLSTCCKRKITPDSSFELSPKWQLGDMHVSVSCASVNISRYYHASLH